MFHEELERKVIEYIMFLEERTDVSLQATFLPFPSKNNGSTKAMGRRKSEDLFG